VSKPRQDEPGHRQVDREHDRDRRHRDHERREAFAVDAPFLLERLTHVDPDFGGTIVESDRIALIAGVENLRAERRAGGALAVAIGCRAAAFRSDSIA
jgi:hypothetical protein